MITDKHLVEVRDHPLGGEQRLYAWGKEGWGASAVNSPVLHSYPYAWEIAITRWDRVDYEVEVLITDEAANAYLEQVFAELA